MKTCPLCAESIQDKAIRCKHCGASLTEPSNATPPKAAEPVRNESSPSHRGLSTVAMAIVGAILGGYFSFALCSPEGATMGFFSKTFLSLEGAIGSAIAFPLAWKIGHYIGRIAQPDFIMAGSGTELLKTRVGYHFLPLALALGGSLGSVLLVASFIEKTCKARSAIIEPGSVAGSSDLSDQATPAPTSSPAEVVEPTSPPEASSNTGEPTSLESFDVRPSFDCTRASMPSEQLICGDRLLVWLDRALSENYRAMLAADLEKDAKRELMKSQHRWLAERNRCTTIECLSTKYRDRIDGVCMYAGRGGMRVNCKSSEDVLVEMQYRTRLAG